MTFASVATLSPAALRQDRRAINATLAAEISAVSLRPINAFALTLLDEPSLHLSDHPEDGKHDMAHLALRADIRVKHVTEAPRCSHS